MATETAQAGRTRATKRRGDRAIWEGTPKPATRLAKAVILALIVVVMLYPFVYVVAMSFATTKAAISDLFFPTHYTLGAYRAILHNGVVTRALEVSVGITLVGTAVSVVFTVLMAYGLTRPKSVPGSKFILYLTLFTMMFAAGIIPTYLLVKDLGLINSYASLIAPGVISAFNLVVVRNFFMELPQEMLDSARLDGANELQVLLRVVLPLSKAVIAVIALFYAVDYWNDFFSAMLYLNDTSKWPIQVIVQQYVLQGSAMDATAQNNPLAAGTSATTVEMATIVASTLPILVVYPFLQRFFIKGVLTGAIKG